MDVRKIIQPIACAATVVALTMLGACNTLEGTGRAAQNITHGIADDARAIVNSANGSSSNSGSTTTQSTTE